LKPERPSDVIPSGPGITTPGSMIYIEPKRQKLQDRVPQQKIQDRVPQQKLQDRVPPSAVNPKPTSAGPYAPAQSDDPFHQRYAKTASYLGQVSRDRKPSEKKEPIQNLYQINKGDTLEKIARKIGGENWQQTLKGIREKNPKIKERALKIGGELILPESK
jgi:nucleoid-associated protein YgaU